MFWGSRFNVVLTVCAFILFAGCIKPAPYDNTNDNSNTFDPCAPEVLSVSGAKWLCGEADYAYPELPYVVYANATGEIEHRIPDFNCQILRIFFYIDVEYSIGSLVAIYIGEAWAQGRDCDELDYPGDYILFRNLAGTNERFTDYGVVFPELNGEVSRPSISSSFCLLVVNSSDELVIVRDLVVAIECL